MATYLGLCSKCGKTKESLDTNLGTVCMECFQEAVYSAKETIFSTGPSQYRRKVFVATWDQSQTNLVTESGLLYAFVRKEDAEYFLRDLRERAPKEEDLRNAVVQEVDAEVLIGYVLTQPGLRMIGVERILKGQAPPNVPQEEGKGGA